MADGGGGGVSGSKLGSGRDGGDGSVGSVEYIGVAQWVSRRYALPLLIMMLGYFAWRWRNGRVECGNVKNGRVARSGGRSGEWYDGVVGAGATSGQAGAMPRAGEWYDGLVGTGGAGGAGGSWFEGLGLVPQRNTSNKKIDGDMDGEKFDHDYDHDLHGIDKLGYDGSGSGSDFGDVVATGWGGDDEGSANGIGPVEPGHEGYVARERGGDSGRGGGGYAGYDLSVNPVRAHKTEGHPETPPNPAPSSGPGPANRSMSDAGDCDLRL